MTEKESIEAKITLIKLEEGIMDSKWDINKSYLEYKEYMSDVWSRKNELHSKYRLIMDYTLYSIPEYGVIYTLGAFRSLAKAGRKLSWDGVGFYGTDRMESDVAILVEDVENRRIRTDFTHVIWYD